TSVIRDWGFVTRQRPLQRKSRITIHESRCLSERSTGGAEVSNPPTGEHGEFVAPLVSLPVEVGLEEECGRDGVSRSAPARAMRPARDHHSIGLGRGETLILNLHGHGYHRAERVDELPHPA